jgi:hypothetical protein
MERPISFITSSITPQIRRFFRESACVKWRRQDFAKWRKVPSALALNQ